MAILKIRTFPDPVLRKRASAVAAFDKDLAKLTDDMLETMYDAPGVGLAANQVGVLKRILVLDVDYAIEGDEEDARTRRAVNKHPRVFVNPELVERRGSILYKEGCLSVPGFTAEVQRAGAVTIRYRDVKGGAQTLSADGLLAVAIQHEMDHLDGKLFIDRLSMAKKSLIKGKISKERGGKFERSRFHVEL